MIAIEEQGELIEALRKGSETAFKAVIQQHQRQVYNVCLSFLGNQEDAEDLAQEVFLTLFEKIEGFRSDATLSTWLYRVAVNKSLEHIRKMKSLKRWGGVKAFLTGEQTSHHPVNFDHPGIVLENKEQAQILMQNVAQLAENQRIAFTLHKMEGLSYAEIADVMKVSLSAVESLIFRANQGLRKSLKDYYQSNYK
ncbi:MAG: RNA polymerase sigma factor (sigma-70 family) [Marinoscillum sp.]|jgi:RNA polymerase sigma factor (sigma-70 family)